MTQPDDTAFPLSDISRDFYEGLSKREYFAALAMQGLLANPEMTKLADETQGGAIESSDIIASMSVTCADALIQALNNNP